MQKYNTHNRQEIPYQSTFRHGSLCQLYIWKVKYFLFGFTRITLINKLVVDMNVTLLLASHALINGDRID